MHSLRNLVVGTDFSAAADAALDFAVGLAKLGNTAITLVHVCEPTEEHGLCDPASDEDVLQTCRVQLLATCSRRTYMGVSITPVLRSGPVADKIHNVATEVGASLIVIGRSARGQLGHTAERVLRTASRPVLAVGSDPLAAMEIQP
jgi:nucleotide-binding universal stress UspA family protein